MAEVFLGEVTGANGFVQRVVIKRLHANLAEQEECRASLLDEARLVSLIRHANVVRIFGVEQTRDGLYLVLEYVEGESLLRVLQRTASTGALTRELSAYICSEVCAGLHAAHETTDEEGRPLGIVHRDVTPSNVVITFDGDVRILDFGIAQAKGRTTKTAVGLLKGKYAYVAPERIKRNHTDRRSDIFGLGVCLWELTTGRRLFKRENQIASLHAIVNGEVTPPSGLDPTYPRELEKIVMRALEVDPKKRYPNALAMRRDLIAFLRHRRFTDTPEVELADLMGRVFERKLRPRRAATRLPTPCTVEVQRRPTTKNQRPVIQPIEEEEVSFDEAATFCEDDGSDSIEVSIVADELSLEPREDTGSLIPEGALAAEASDVEDLFATYPNEDIEPVEYAPEESVEVTYERTGDVNLSMVKKGIAIGVATASVLVFTTAFFTAEPASSEPMVVIAPKKRPVTRLQVAPILVAPEPKRIEPKKVQIRRSYTVKSESRRTEVAQVVERDEGTPLRPKTRKATKKRKRRRSRARKVEAPAAPEPAAEEAPAAKPEIVVVRRAPAPSTGGSKYERFD